MNNVTTGAFEKLEQGVHAALETYSNVHRGSGYNSMVSTHLFEQARDIILEYLSLDKSKYIIIFCTPRRASVLMSQIDPGKYQYLSSSDIGLPLGVGALAVKRKALPKGNPFQTGGGTTRLISRESVIWANAPDKFEAGTPAIINVIAFARSLRLIKQFGDDIFRDEANEKQAANDQPASGNKLTAKEILYHDELAEYSGQELLDKIKQTLIGRRISVPTVEGARPYTNLDNSASTPTFTPIWKAVQQTWHQPKQIQAEIIQEVRAICAEVMDAPLAAYDIIFTSNTTEGINLAAESLYGESEQDTEPIVLNTLLEHSSNDLPWRMIPHFSLIRLSVDSEGLVDLNELDTLLSEYNQKGPHGKKRIRLVAMSGASNVLGIFNNIAEISRIVHQYGARLLVDAAQLAAHRKIDMEGCGIDYLAFSAHKVYAPFGCGVLIVRKGLLNFNSADMELIQSSGEENAGGIAALGKALVLMQRIGINVIQKEEQALTARSLKGLAQIDGLTIYGIKNPDSPRFSQKGGVIVFGLKGIMSNMVARKLAEQGGIGVRYGCHCSHLLIKYLLNVSPFLERFQGLMLTLLPKVKLPGLVRVSLGIENSEEDVDKLIYVLGKIATKNRTSKDRKSKATPEEPSILRQADVQKQMSDLTRIVEQRVYDPMIY